MAPCELWAWPPPPVPSALGFAPSNQLEGADGALAADEQGATASRSPLPTALSVPQRLSLLSDICSRKPRSVPLTSCDIQPSKDCLAHGLSGLSFQTFSLLLIPPPPRPPL